MAGPAKVIERPRTYPRPSLTRRQADEVARDLLHAVRLADARPEVVRLALAVHLSKVTGARHGELATMLTAYLDPTGGWVRLRRFPQGRRADNPVYSDHPMDEPTIYCALRWLRVRERLTAGMRGGQVAALMVTVHHTVDRGVLLRAGLPIKPNGLERSWHRYALAQNALGRPGTVLPTRYEPLRRAWWPA